MFRVSFLSIMVVWLLASACSSEPEITILHNVNGYTLLSDGSLHEFGAIAFSEGKVLMTGTDEEILGAYPAAARNDGNGRTMLPGLIDAHAHVMGLGESLLRVNLMGAQSVKEAVGWVKSYADENQDLEWILGRGWNQTHWTVNEFPTAADLDAVVSDRPVFLRRVDGHAAWANTMALEIAGITADTPDPPGGAILRDANGRATGVLIDRAMYLVGQHVPEPGDYERRRALDLALGSIAEHGITGVHDAGTGVEAYQLFREYADKGKMTSRIFSMISGAGETFDILSANGPYVDGQDLVFLKSVKLYSDGALGSRGAALKEDYSDDPGNRGLLFDTEEAFYQQIKKVASKGFQVGIHAIGDNANYTILNAFERYLNEAGDQGLRHRIEHSQIVSVEDIPRFREIGLIASMQPVHATSDMNMAEDRVGPDRILGGYAWRKFLDQGTVIASGSDFPVEKVNAFHGLHAAVNRTDHDGNPPGGWYPEQAMTRTEALRSFTLDAAYAGLAEDRLGTLETGKWADFIIIDRDYFTIDSADIWKIEVLETWLAGKRVY